MFNTGYLGHGDFVNCFENKLSGLFKRDVVCVSSGTAALHLSLEALGIGNGDEVLVQSLTYGATYQAIAVTGSIPVSCDINELDLMIDLSDAKRKITNKTRAIIPVHYSGSPGDLKRIYQFADENNLYVIEDAAHAFGTKYDNKLIGQLGDIICFSFDPVKNITCGQGGAIITNDKNFAQKVKLARVLGIEKNRKENIFEYKLEVDSVNEKGWRYHMTNVNAAIGLAQLEKFEFLKNKRQNLAKKYVSNLAGNKHIGLLPYDFDSVVPYIFVIKLQDKYNYDIINELKDFGIHAGFHYYPCHLQPFFRKLYECKLPVTENLYGRLLSLPLHPGLEFTDIDYVSESLENILNK